MQGCSAKRTEKLELYAVQYGTSTFAPNFVFYKTKMKKPVPFAWLFYVVKYKNRVILFDTGFQREKLRKIFKVTLTKPLELLKKMGISPEMVTDVVLTHRHFDHGENAFYFKNAQIYVHKKEFQRMKREGRPGKTLRFLKNHKKLTLMKDKEKLFNKFILQKWGSHSTASMTISFSHSSKKYLLAGDEVYLKKNIHENIPSGSAINIKKNRAFIKWVKSQKNLIIYTFHEPGIVPGGNGVHQLIK